MDPVTSAAWDPLSSRPADRVPSSGAKLTFHQKGKIGGILLPPLSLRARSNFCRKKFDILRETICMLLLPACLKACQEDFAVPGQNWRNFATARPARKSDFANAYLREEIRAARSQNLLLAINPFRAVGGPKGRLFQLIWSRPAGQGCQEVAPSLETSPTASDSRQTPATVPSGPRTHT